MELNTIKDAFDRVAKKQKLSCSKTQEVIDQIILEIEKALEKTQSACDPDSQLDCKNSLSDLRTILKDIAPLSQLEGTQKELT
jgi:hypothetical protein